MKRLIYSVIVLLFCISLKSQIFNPISWDSYVEEDNDNTYLIIKANLDKGWHLYSQNVDGSGPIPTSFSFDKSNSYSLIDSVVEPEGEIVFDKSFNMELKYLSGEVIFKQEINIKSKDPFDIKAKVDYMVCDSVRCLPPDEKNFVFKINYKGDDIKAIANDSNISDKGENLKTKNTLFIFWLSFLGGLIAILTPCVLPMVPITVSFFSKFKGGKSSVYNALLYSLSIIAIYVLLGYSITKIFGSDAMNALATNFWFNIAFFVIFVIFALSFMGLFEITIPSAFVNRVNKQSNKGGIIGIFFMAFTLALVSFSCTGPIIGTLLVEAAINGGTKGPLIGMFGFSLALALPFGIFAIFPSWLSSLPKSGSWMNTLKVTLGFIELALAFKFLSNADLVMQLHLLERELFLSIWVVIFACLGFYLLGKLKLDDNEIKYISIGRLIFGMLSLTFTIYLFTGLWGGPLKIISGFPPPLNYSESKPMSMNKSTNVSYKKQDESMKIGVHNIPYFDDYDKGMEYAKRIKKPVLMDFTGYACVNCRRMEDKVWSDDRVSNILKNELVLISLYVDDKRALPEKDFYKSSFNGKLIKTIGQKWSDFQATNFGNNSQPYYIILDNQGNRMNSPKAYDTDINSYVDWLREGIRNYK